MSLTSSLHHCHEYLFRIECYDKKRAAECCTTVRLRYMIIDDEASLPVLTSLPLCLLAWREPFTLASLESTPWIRTTLAETCPVTIGTCSDTWTPMTTGYTTGTGDPTRGLTGWWMPGGQKFKRSILGSVCPKESELESELERELIKKLENSELEEEI